MKISYCFTDSDEPCGLLKCIASCFDDDVSLAVSVCLGCYFALQHSRPWSILAHSVQLASKVLITCNIQDPGRSW